MSAWVHVIHRIWRPPVSSEIETSPSFKPSFCLILTHREKACLWGEKRRDRDVRGCKQILCFVPPLAFVSKQCLWVYFTLLPRPICAGVLAIHAASVRNGSQEKQLSKAATALRLPWHVGLMPLTRTLAAFWSVNGRIVGIRGNETNTSSPKRQMMSKGYHKISHKILVSGQGQGLPENIWC